MRCNVLNRNTHAFRVILSLLLISSGHFSYAAEKAQDQVESRDSQYSIAYGDVDASYSTLEVPFGDLEKLYVMYDDVLNGFRINGAIAGEPSYRVSRFFYGAPNELEQVGICIGTSQHNKPYIAGLSSRSRIGSEVAENHMGRRTQCDYRSTHLLRDNLDKLVIWSDGHRINGLQFVYSRAQNIDDSTEEIKEEKQVLAALKALKVELATDFNEHQFLYSVLHDSGRIGVLSYDRQHPINVSVSEIRYEALEIIECGSRDGFKPRPRIFNHEEIFGTSGFESISSLCHIARNNEFKWFDGRSLGVDIWYSTNLVGDVQCFSFNGNTCLWRRDYSVAEEFTQDAGFDSDNHPGVLSESIVRTLHLTNQLTLNVSDTWKGHVTLPQGVSQAKRIVLVANRDVDVQIVAANGSIKHDFIKSGGVKSWLYIGNQWWPEGTNLNNYKDITRLAKPVVCDLTESKDGWCTKIIAPEQSYRKDTISALIDAKLDHMDRLFTASTNNELSNVEKENNYSGRLKSLSSSLKTREAEKIAACAGLIYWRLAGVLACSILSVQYNDLEKEHKALLQERTDKVAAVYAKKEKLRETKWHELHQKWSINAESNNRYHALLLEESRSLAELKKLKDGYDKSSEVDHEEYLKALHDYTNVIGSKSVLRKSIEDLPLVGLEMKHILDYTDNPSGRNLRRMLLGLTGPVGEQVEGGIEVVLGESGNTGSLYLIGDILKRLTEEKSTTDIFAEIVGDAINDLGDEAIESIRQAGLWRDHSSEESLIDLRSRYLNIVDLRARAERVEYDFWSGSSQPEISVQNKFRIASSDEPPKESSLDEIQSIYQNLLEQYIQKNEFDKKLTGIFSHAFGSKYKDVFDSGTENENQELLRVITDPAYYEQRMPHWVTSEVIGHRPAGFIYNEQHGFIVLNKQLVSVNSSDFYKFYFEELGHMVNWWRCKIAKKPISDCQVAGDAGARFRDAILLDESRHSGSFESLLMELPSYTNVDASEVAFQDGSFATIEAWPNYYTINDHIVGGGKFSWLLRLGMDFPSEEFKVITDEFDLEAIIRGPVPMMKGDPWKTSANGYCKSDHQTDCNMPTMWLSIGFRDALKMSVAKTPTFKESKLANLGFDVSPVLMRKHGGKLPFQLSSVNGTTWEYIEEDAMYAKRFTVYLVTKLNLWKMTQILKGISPSKVHKPELSLKSLPAIGNFVVEMGAKDRSELNKWLALDITSSVVGCAAGFIIGVVAETDPITLCEVSSDLSEAVETILQGLDSKPMMYFESEGDITLPTAVEYSYAGGTKTGQHGGGARVVYHPSAGTPTSEVGLVSFDSSGDIDLDAPTHVDQQQVSSLKRKMSNSLSRLTRATIQPIFVFRFRVGFKYGEQIIQEGEYRLPTKLGEN